MADKLIRIGRVSKIDYEKGMISVTYPDLDDAVSTLLSVLSFNDEYKMPKPGEEVAVLHLPSGQSRGIVLGHYWNETNKPQKTGADVYRKELGHEPGEAYLEYKDGSGLTIRAPEITLSGNAGSITLTQIKELERKVNIMWNYYQSL